MATQGSSPGVQATETGTVLTRVRSLVDQLPPAQQTAGRFVLEHAEEIPFLSVREFAEAADVSVASISRLARTLGYPSFKAFKVSLGRDSLTAFEGIFEAIAPGDSDDTVIEKTFLGNIRSLEETLGLIRAKDLIAAAKAIAAAGRVVVFGIGSSGCIAQDAALRLGHLDVPAVAYFDSYQMLNQSLRMRRGDVALALSHSGRSTITVEALDLARECGAKTIGVSNYLRSPLHAASDIFLCTSFPESRVKVAALSSRIAQMCVIDALYLLVARHTKARPRSAERLNTYTEKLLRLPTRGGAKD